ncbi:hypothetical protein OK016_01615 [Vibrio chagasii]|nr:hypothetical protein [Vibrio chagasii]
MWQSQRLYYALVGLRRRGVRPNTPEAAKTGAGRNHVSLGSALGYLWRGCSFASILLLQQGTSRFRFVLSSTQFWVIEHGAGLVTLLIF